MTPTYRDQIVEHIRIRGVVRTRDVIALGVPPVTLTRMVREGVLERVARGVYVLPAEGLGSGSALAVVAVRVPGAVVCLGSALQLHELSSWSPSEVWIAVASHRRPPKVDWPPLHVVYVQPKLMDLDVQVPTIDGVVVRVTGPARTVADCFKWRGTVGLDIALEALRAYVVDQRRSRDELRRIAEQLRVAEVMRPYLESMS